MMINKRLIGTVSESKKYIAGSVAFQWCDLAANICMVAAVGRLLEGLYLGTARGRELWLTAGIALCAAAVRYGCTVGAARMGYLSSRAVLGCVWVFHAVYFLFGVRTISSDTEG